MKKFYLKVFGCQMNINDAQKIKGILKSENYEETLSEEEADLILINTCTIREKPDNKVFSYLGELKKIKEKNKNLKIGVCGCLAQRVGEEIYFRAPHVDILFGTLNIHSLPKLLEEANKGNKAIEIIEELDKNEIELENYPTVRDNPYIAYVTIIRGCDKNCTYCVVPKTRGRERSRLPEYILKEVEALVKDGVKEIHLLGQNVTAYGKDIDYPFYRLLKDIAYIDGVERIRFTTGHPIDLTDKVIEAIGELDKVVNHIHLPFQSGSNKILKLMDRNYTKEYYLNRVNLLKEVKKDMSFSADVIVGFPYETDEDFEETLDLIEKVEFEQLFSFKYSKRPNTIAFDIKEEVPDDIKTQRMTKLLELQKKISEKLFKRYENTYQKVLIEEKSKDFYIGRTTSNAWVNVKSNEDILGKIVNVLITKAKPNSLEGVCV